MHFTITQLPSDSEPQLRPPYVTWALLQGATTGPALVGQFFPFEYVNISLHPPQLLFLVESYNGDQVTIHNKAEQIKPQNKQQ